MTSLPDGMFLDQYGNAKRKVDDLSGAELRYFEQYRAQELARNNQLAAQAQAAAAQAQAAAPANVAPADMTPAEEIVALKPKVSNQPDYGFKFPEGPPGYYPAVMVDWRNPVTGETASFTAGMEPPAGSPWEKGRYTPEEQNQIKKDINLTPAEIEETIVPPVAAPFQPIVPPVAAPIPPTIPNLPSLELPQMVPPAQEGIASLAPLPTVPASQPFIPAPAPTNTGYNFQELLNMYKNPYA